MAKEAHSKFLKAFGENLMQVRQTKGLTQRGLASLCSIDHSDISKMERGEINITIVTLQELASALEVKPKKLLDFE